jgi:hypothetical protein
LAIFFTSSAASRLGASAVAVLVGQDPALAPAALGDQHAGARERRGVPLDEFHVAQWHAVAKRHAHAVAGDDPGVRVLAVDAAGAAGAQDHRLGAEEEELPRGDLDREHALHAAVLDHQVGAEELVVAADRRVLHRGLEEGMQHVEAALVGGEPRALDLHPAEEAHVDVPVVLAAPRAAPVLELRHLLGAMGDEVLDHVLVAQPVPARDGVVEVVVEAVVGPDHARRPALRGHGMAAHRDDFRDQRDLQGGVALGHGDRRAQPRAAAADDHHVGIDDLHPSPLRRFSPPRPGSSRSSRATRRVRTCGPRCRSSPRPR